MFLQHIIVNLSCDGKFSNAIESMHTKISTEKIDECVDTMECNKEKWFNVNKILEIAECTCSIQKVTTSIEVSNILIS